jgi:hypothetical protein
MWVSRFIITGKEPLASLCLLETLTANEAIGEGFPEMLCFPGAQPDLDHLLFAGTFLVQARHPGGNREEVSARAQLDEGPLGREFLVIVKVAAASAVREELGVDLHIAPGVDGLGPFLLLRIV